MAMPNPNEEKLKQILKERQRDIGRTYKTLAEISPEHPEVAEDFIAKVRVFVDHDPSLLDDKIPLGVRELTAVVDAHVKLEEFRNAKMWEARGKNFGRKPPTTNEEAETSALAVSTQSGVVAGEDFSSGTSQSVSDSRQKHLETLGIEEGSTPEQVKKAYREKLLESHPDIVAANGANEEEVAAAHEKTIALNEAFAALYVTSSVAEPLPVGQPTAPTPVSRSQNMPGSELFQTASNQATGFAKGQFQKRVGEPLKQKIGSFFAKKAGKEAAEAAAKTAVKTVTKETTKAVAKTAAKTSLKVAAEGLLGASGVGAPVALIIEVADRILSAVLKIIKKIGRSLNNFIAAITGTNDPRKNFGYMMIGGGLTLILATSQTLVGVGMMAGGAAVGVSPGLVTSAIGAFLLVPKFIVFTAVMAVVNLVANLFLAVVLLIVWTTVTYLIIQMGAVVVPQGGFGTQTEIYNIHGGNPPPGYPGIPPFPTPTSPPGGNIPPAGYFGNGQGCDYVNPLPGLEAYTCQHGAGVVGMIDAYACIGTPLVAPFDGCAFTYNDSVGGPSVIMWPTDPSGNYQDNTTSNCPSIYFTHLSDNQISGTPNELGCIPVTQGQVIGHTGCSGTCGSRRTPPHTHMVCSTLGIFYTNANADVDCVSFLSAKAGFACKSYSEISDQIHNEPIECLLHPYN